MWPPPCPNRNIPDPSPALVRRKEVTRMNTRTRFSTLLSYGFFALVIVWAVIEK
ncbi:hypothetical protein [Fundidesulfovibrio butyratiphilus]